MMSPQRITKRKWVDGNRILMDWHFRCDHCGWVGLIDERESGCCPDCFRDVRSEGEGGDGLFSSVVHYGSSGKEYWKFNRDEAGIRRLY